MDKSLKIIGGGMAGCEAAWQAANMGIDVNLFEMSTFFWGNNQVLLRF